MAHHPTLATQVGPARLRRAWAGYLAIAVLLPALAELSPAGMSVLGIVFWASMMWVSEAMPLGSTGPGIPLLLMLSHAIAWPVRNGVAQPSFEAAFTGFTNDVVWLCLFAFRVGSVMRLAGLDRRVAVAVFHQLWVRTDGQVIWGMFGANLALCFLLPAANARTTARLPLVSSVAYQLADDDPRSTSARKAIVIQPLVYGSMIAGVAIMTAHLPNFILVKLFADHGFRIGFFQWFALNAPYLGMFGLTQIWVKRLFHAIGTPPAWKSGTHRVHARRPGANERCGDGAAGHHGGAWRCCCCSGRAA